jgi:pimeloyl-ACP methyl ester carboxylesterase
MMNTPLALAALDHRTETRRRDIAGYAVQASLLQEGSGDTPPVAVLVHGMVDSSESWAPLLGALPGWCVWALDLPWSGTQGPAWPGVMPTDAWLEACLALCPAPDLIVAHSYGATAVLASRLAARTAAHPGPRGMVLLAPLLSGVATRLSWADMDAFVHSLPAYLQAGLRARLGARPGAAPPPQEVLDHMTGMLVERVLPDAMLELFRLYGASRRWDLASLDCPTLVLAGAQDQGLCTDGYIRLRAAAPPIRTVMLEACGHYPVHECQAALSGHMAAFLADQMEMSS